MNFDAIVLSLCCQKCIFGKSTFLTSEQKNGSKTKFEAIYNNSACKLETKLNKNNNFDFFIRIL